MLPRGTIKQIWMSCLNLVNVGIINVSNYSTYSTIVHSCEFNMLIRLRKSRLMWLLRKSEIVIGLALKFVKGRGRQIRIKMSY